MAELFLIVLNMSVTAGLVIAVILSARAVLHHAPRKYSLIMWALALFRLVCPVSLPSMLSVFRVGMGASPVVVDAGAMSYRGFDLLTPPIADSILGAETINTLTNTVGSVDAATGAATGSAGGTSLNIVQIFAIIWIGGALVMLVYGALSYIQMKRCVATSVRLDGNVYESDAIRSPFVLGFLRPRIYIPFGLADTPCGYILAHERHHIARGDHITKLLAYLTLSMHWFNPLVWIAFLLFSKDMEMSCDEHILRFAEASAKREYSLSMLSVAVNRRFPVPSPVAFGESGVPGRIKNVLRFRRPKRWVTVISVLLCVLIIASCATNPLMQSGPNPTPPVIQGTEVSDYYPAHTASNEAVDTTIVDLALEAYKAVLENKSEFYSTQDKKDVFLSDFFVDLGNSVGSHVNFKATHFAILDMDGDKVPEVVVEVSLYSPVYFEILHFMNGTVYSYNIPHLGFLMLKSDGTFWSSEGTTGSRCETLIFKPNTYETDILAYNESSNIENNINVSYVINNNSVTEESFMTYMYEHKQKPDAPWHEFSQANIDAEFKSDKITFQDKPIEK